MINLPYNVASMSQVTPCQNVPVQTSQYNFPTCQQRHTSTQQMQTAACGPCSGISQGPIAHVYQPDTYVVTHQCTPSVQPITNPCHTVFQNPIPPTSHPSCAQLPQHILDQIRACISNSAPIFILPGSYQQTPAAPQQQQPSAPTLPQTMTSPPTYPPSGLTYPAACYPPPFYPYPVPFPLCDPFIRARETTQNCGCCRRRDVDPLSEIRNVARASCRYDTELDEHRCTPTTDDTICSKRSCPSSLHLQALASQFLSMQGVVACAATRLVLRKVPGSNVTTTMEDTMARAQKAINALTKDQLLSESRNAQQVNALINLHMTANPPPNVIPILTLIQLKMNLLKAQVEALVNQKLMDIQGVGVEVDTELIDPTILALKSDAELRDFLSVLRQKECDERVNVNFAPYRSQRAIAETRLSNVQKKLRQVEAEFDRRRCAMLPAPTLSTRVLQQFSRPCYSARFEDPRKLYSALPPVTSPDPFVAKPRSPKRLLLKPCVVNPETAAQVAGSTSPGRPDAKTTDGGVSRTTQERSTVTEQRTSAETCACDRTTSEESVGEAKKKLRPRVVEIDATVCRNAGEESREVSLMKLTSDVCVRIGTERCEMSARKQDETTDDGRRWMTETYVNVVDDESVKTLTESESDTITLSEKIDAGDVCESRDAIVIRCLDEIMDGREGTVGSAANLRQPEEQAETEVAISKREVAIKECDIPTESLQNISLTKAEQEEVKATAALEIVDDAPILRTQETEQESQDGMYTSTLQIVLKPKKDKREGEQKDGNNNNTSSLSMNGTAEQSTKEVPISKSKKKIRFQITSLLTNIVYDKDRKNQRKRNFEEKTMATSRREMSITTSDPDIEKLHKYSSMNNLLKSAITSDIIEKDHPKNIFSERVEYLKKLYVNRQCQTVFEIIKEDKKMSATLLKENIFPPLKNLRKHISGNEKNGGTYPSPITKTGITATKRLSCCKDVTENILEAPCEDNAPYLPSVECEESFISDIFSVIGNRLVAFINKIITLNRKLLYSSRNVILRKSLNIDVSKEAAPIRDQSGLVLKDYDPLAGTLHYPPDPSQGTSRTSKYDFHDTNLLRVSAGEGFDKIHKLRHSIIEDKENGAKYLLISTSNHNHDLILTRDLGWPYEIRRSLLIRSRLKNSTNSQDCPHPFSLLKRTRKNVFESDEMKRNESIEIIEKRKIHELKSSEKFWTLSKDAKINENNYKILEMKEYSKEYVTKNSKQYNDDLKQQISRQHSQNYIKNKVLIKEERATSNEFVTNIYNYVGLQANNEININTCENHNASLVISNN